MALKANIKFDVSDLCNSSLSDYFFIPTYLSVLSMYSSSSRLAYAVKVFIITHILCH